MTDPDPGFTPISPNPFIVGNPVRGRTMFFGREAEFDLVRRRFEHSTHGGLLVFCGERRSGKTSILFQILDHRLGPAFIPVLIDMQSMAVTNEIEFLTRLCEAILAAIGSGTTPVGLPLFAAESSRSATFSRFVQDVLKGHPDKKLILLFDEYELFENKIDAGLLAEDVLHVLASLMENQPVFLIFTGSQHIEQRRREYWKILGRSLYKTISFLERSDALNLIQKPVEGRVEYAEGVVEAIYRLSAGQAFYTQAICQSLVDRLNEQHTRLVTQEMLAEVVDAIINNPLPQMIFLWDGLERDDKLALALLAEAVADDVAYTGVDPIMRHLRQRGYPLQLDKAVIAPTLEKLFKTDMLLRNDRADEHEYTFRMDLWRRWIKRQHSVWQVMREEKLEIRSQKGWRRPLVRQVGAVVVATAVVALVLKLSMKRDEPPIAGATNPTGPIATFVLAVTPEAAEVQLDGRRMGMGSFRDAVAANQKHRFLLTAAGYADTELVVSLAAGATDSQRVTLRELFGALSIETQPTGAELRVDGKPVGKSPARLPSLSAARTHRVTAALKGYAEKQQDVTLKPGAETAVALNLAAGTVGLLIVTEPSGGQIVVDGAARGESPAQIQSMTGGKHTIVATKEGFLPADTTLNVNEATGTVRLTLLRKPPGVLVVQGDKPVTIYIDEALVVGGVQHARREVSEGSHQVRIVLKNGETLDKSVTVKSGERATYDFSQDTVTHRSEAP